MKGTGSTKWIYLLYHFKYHSSYNSVSAFLLFPENLIKWQWCGAPAACKRPWEGVFSAFFQDEGNEASGAFEFLIVQCWVTVLQGNCLAVRDTTVLQSSVVTDVFRARSKSCVDVDCALQLFRWKYNPRSQLKCERRSQWIRDRFPTVPDNPLPLRS